MDKKVKVFIVIILIIIVILIGILSYLFYILKNEPQELEEEEIYYSDQDTHFRSELEKVTSKYDYFDTEACIRKYISSLQKLDTMLYQEDSNTINNTIEIYKEELYNLLDETYINKNKVTLQNMDKNFSDYYATLNFEIENMYVVDAQEELAIYFVYGTLVNTKKNTVEKYGFIVKRDTQNLLFTIIPYDYMLENGYKKEEIEKQNLDELKNTTIKANDNNYYTSNAYDDEYISNYYFNLYKKNLQYNVDNIYYNMEKEYREKRFGTLQNYKDYVEKNDKELLKCNLNQYIKEIKDNFTNYICKDQYGNYYIFKQTNIGEYTVMLDTYTIQQEKFKKEYEVATNSEKVGMNISKWFQMLNAKDYHSAYSVLSTSFKNKNFMTEKVFEQYIRNTLYSYNDVNLINFSDEISGIYTYYIEITDKENKENTTIKINIIMELLQDTDYQISFEIVD